MQETHMLQPCKEEKVFLEQRDFVSEKLVASNGESWLVVESWNTMDLSALQFCFC